jgi:hypothetical protein
VVANLPLPQLPSVEEALPLPVEGG